VSVLTQVAERVFVHTSEWVDTNTVVVAGRDGVLVIDPGIHASELACLEQDLADAGWSVVLGFSTHPHWDHLLWTPGLGEVPRYATAACAETAHQRLSGGLDPERAKAVGVPDDVPLDLIGAVVGLPSGADTIPWDGPEVRVLEHRAHAAGHAALLVPGSHVLVAGDLLSDVLVPMPDMGAAEPFEDYLDALALLEKIADDVDVLVPGHGSVATGSDVRARIEQDTAYVVAKRDGQQPTDPRFDPFG
jgi:glyoxylase-like metal-dependent hydrolase (beta-lactamase superfamily II)